MTNQKPNSMEAAAEENCQEYDGCFTGDCPHEKAIECGKHCFKLGYCACLHSPEIEAVRNAVRHGPQCFWLESEDRTVCKCSAFKALAALDFLIQECEG